MRAVASTGCEVVACDVTGRPRPNGEKLADIVYSTIKKELSPYLLESNK